MILRLPIPPLFTLRCFPPPLLYARSTLRTLLSSQPSHRYQHTPLLPRYAFTPTLAFYLPSSPLPIPHFLHMRTYISLLTQSNPISRRISNSKPSMDLPYWISLDLNLNLDLDLGSILFESTHMPQFQLLFSFLMNTYICVCVTSSGLVCLGFTSIALA